MTATTNAATSAALANDAEHWIKSFKKEGKRPYWDQLEQLMGSTHDKGHAVFTIQHQDLPDNLAIILLHSPEEFLEAVKNGALYIEREIHPDFEQWLRFHLEIEIYEVPTSRRLDRGMLAKFMALGPCQVHRIEPLRNIKMATKFRCTSCYELIDSRLVEGALKQPTRCPKCNERQLAEVSEHIELQDQRYVEVIMVSDAGLATEKALKYWVDVRGEKAFNIPDFGETWVVSGIVRLSEEKDTGPISEHVTHFLYLEVNTIQKVATSADQQVEVTPDLMAIRRKWVANTLAEKKDVESELVKYVMPDIVGEDLLKLSLLRQAVSGAVENVGERTEIHILVLRNPGRAKSDLAMFFAALTGGAYVPAEGASEVGLTVGLETDERTKKKAAKAGVAVLYNRKNVYLDEVDKLKKKWEVLPSLNTPMDKGFYIETKIFNKTFETRSTWTMFGNFRHRSYDHNRSLQWNIDLPSDTLDRCDLWHIDPSTHYDDAMMEAIMESQSNRFESGKKKIVIDRDLQIHMACAKSIKEIKFEPGVRDIFKQFFRDMKKLEAHMGGVKITNRMFNGLWRQAIARAVLHLRDTVIKQDAEVAIKHLTEVLAKIGIDAATGEVNVDKITGDVKGRQKKLQLFKTIMQQAQGSRTQDISEEVLLQILQQVPQYKKKEDAIQLLNEAKESDMIRSTRPGWWILITK